MTRRPSELFYHQEMEASMTRRPSELFYHQEMVAVGATPIIRTKRLDR
jgi:hypothetical protein